MLFTDTDSLGYEIKPENAYEEFFKWRDLFDFSNYPKDSKFFDPTNKNIIGKMKAEFGSYCRQIYWIKAKYVFYNKN